MNKTIYPCVLLINDIHVSKDNIPDFRLNWLEALSICERKGINVIAVGGDLFQSRSAQTLDVLLAVYDMLEQAHLRAINVILANGNHDLIDQEAIRGYCHIFGKHENVTVVDDFLTINQDDWQFDLHMIAYFPEKGSFTDKLNTLIKGGLNKDKQNILYIHEGINGALLHCSDNELPAHIFGDFNKVFVGHYHNRCNIPKTNIEYIGSSRQHNFGEDEEKGYTVLYSNAGREFIKNNVNTRYKNIDIPLDKLTIHLTDQLEELKAEGRYKVKVRVHALTTEVSGLDKNALLKSGASKVEIITKEPEVREIESTSLFEKFDNRKIKENYQEFCLERKIENVSLGLGYLSKIDNYVEIN